ncbi:MAG: caspase family protein [Terracidiphilus sp.]|jgi:hypothetical protein
MVQAGINSGKMRLPREIPITSLQGNVMAPTHLSLPLASAHRPSPGRRPGAAFRVVLALAVAFPALHGSCVSAQESRGFEQTAEVTQADHANGNYYALVIGIDKYPAPMKELKTAVNDANAIGSLLQDRYGFQVQYLLDQDATRFKILDALSRYRNTLNENDSLLIYYAGHGYSDRDAEKAYWLPADADSGTSPNRIIADDLTTGVRVLPSRHVLIVSDSCYSGGLSRDADEPEHAGSQSAFIARMLKSRSRTLMASGGDEPVSDSGSNGHSVFAYAVLRALERTDQPIFTASDLFYGSIRQQVAGKSSQLPQYTIIRNSDHDEGDFVFMRKAASDSAAMKATATKATLTPLDTFNRGEALIKENRYGDAVPLMTTACNGGNAGGCTALGLMYQNSQGVAQDEFKAVALYRKACDGGNAKGCTNLGWMTEIGRGADKNLVQAVSLYRKACDAGDAMGCELLGIKYLNGVGIAKDDAQAVALARKACDGGYARGCHDLGWVYESGKGVAQDYSQAIALNRKACDAGDAMGCNSLGLYYAAGKGVSQDNDQATAFYRKACDSKFAVACSNLGWMYQNGKGVAQDNVQAVALYRKACDGGFAAGCGSLGLAFANGNGVGKDDTQAVAFYRKACDGNDMTGCNLLGLMYFSGRGVAKDEAQAVALSRKACDGGFKMGCSNLGRLYEMGKGVEKDLQAAAKLYRQACDAGVEDGCRNLKRIQP